MGIKLQEAQNYGIQNKDKFHFTQKFMEPDLFLQNLEFRKYINELLIF